MNTQNTTIQIRIDQKTKKQAKRVFDDLGIDISSGIKIFLNQVIKKNSIPFSITKNPKDIKDKWDKEVLLAKAKNSKSKKDFIKEIESW